MKVTYALSEKMTVELEGADQKSIFEGLSTLTEVFGEDTCKACGSTNIRFVVRENDGNKFYELKCTKCGARLSYGSHKVGGTLFPKRKGADNTWLENNGWVKYVKPTN